MNNNMENGAAFQSMNAVAANPLMIKAFDPYGDSMKSYDVVFQDIIGENFSLCATYSVTRFGSYISKDEFESVRKAVYDAFETPRKWVERIKRSHFFAFVPPFFCCFCGLICLDIHWRDSKDNYNAISAEKLSKSLEQINLTLVDRDLSWEIYREPRIPHQTSSDKAAYYYGVRLIKSKATLTVKKSETSNMEGLPNYHAWSNK